MELNWLITSWSEIGLFDVDHFILLSSAHSTAHRISNIQNPKCLHFHSLEMTIIITLMNNSHAVSLDTAGPRGKEPTLSYYHFICSGLYRSGGYRDVTDPPERTKTGNITVHFQRLGPLYYEGMLISWPFMQAVNSLS